MLTDDERRRVKGESTCNSSNGIQWTLKDIAHYVNIGHDKIEKDEKTRNIIDSSLRSL